MIKNSIRRNEKSWEWKTTEIDLNNIDFAMLDGVESVSQCVNDYYTVIVCRFVDKSARLTILDDDMRHNWGHYQRIKDELLGINWEGVELYTARYRLVDLINAYHIWCRPTPFAIGWDNTATYSANGACFTGAIPIDDLIEKVAGFIKDKDQATRIGRLQPCS